MTISWRVRLVLMSLMQQYNLSWSEKDKDYIVLTREGFPNPLRCEVRQDRQ